MMIIRELLLNIIFAKSRFFFKGVLGLFIGCKVNIKNHGLIKQKKGKPLILYCPLISLFQFKLFDLL